MLNFVIFAVAAFILLTVISFVFSFDKFNKLIVFNHMNNMVILFTSVLASFKYNSFYIDVAIIYMFLGFIFTQALLKYYIAKEFEEQDGKISKKFHL